MSIAEVISAVNRFAAEELNLQGKVIAVTPEADGWRVLMEAVVEDEYMRQRARRDLVATFEIILSADLVVQSFERKTVHERGAL